ncbi:MAG: ATP-dependent zinc metalloprotease FtsH [Myxococcota bacterium]
MFNRIPRSWIAWVVVILGIGLIFSIVTDTTSDPKTVPFSDFRAAVTQGHVKSVEITNLEIVGTYTEEHAKKVHEGSASFTTTGPVGEDMQDLLLAHDVSFAFVEPKDTSLTSQIAIMVLIALLVIAAMVIIMRQFQSGSGKAMTFGKSRARMLNESQNKITFNDIAGIDEAKEELQEVVEFLKNPKKFTRLGGRIPKGVLLMGSPGTGKTLLARGVAGEAGVPFFSISGSDFVEMFVGVGASRVRDLFEQGKKHAPCIIFIDEIDAVGRHRGSGMGGGHDEREQTLNQLLVEMDGFESNEGVILVAATNRPDVLDPALLRPGRFDRRVVVAPPDVRGREQILKIHTRRTPLARDIDLSKIARGTPGFSGADLENLVNEAALLAARLNKDRIELGDFEDAKDKVLMGAERRSAVIGEREREVTAYHEAGHALVAIMLEETDPVHKVTIVPRGRALGVTQQLPSEDRYTMTKEYIVNRIAVIMGGRAAEELVYDKITTGAGTDIHHATEMASKLDCEWGMSEIVGPQRNSEPEGSPFLGVGPMAQARPYSEAMAERIDKELHRIITEQYDVALHLLTKNRDALELLSAALLEFEVIDADEIELLLADRNLEELRRRRELRAAEERSRQAERSPKSGFSSKLKDQLSDLTKPSLHDPSEAF